MLIRDEGRALATLERIKAITPIEGADAIESAQVRDWNVVVRKDEFRVDDYVVFFEIDTALPLDDPEFAFLEPRGSRLCEGRKYHILKTARLRGTYSQGLVIPAGHFVNSSDFEDGADLTEHLNLYKWEPDLPTGGQQEGGFLLNYARKTDSERVQNLRSKWSEIRGVTWEATEKVDGTSCTVTRDMDGNLRVCSRNWEIGDGDNIYWRTLREANFNLVYLCQGESFQAEIVGPGIQGNPLMLPSVRFVVFAFITNMQYQPRTVWPQWALDSAAPIYALDFPNTPEEAVQQANGIKSLLSPGRPAEGIVWHTLSGQGLPGLDGRNTFKVVSNKYLLKGV